MNDHKCPVCGKDGAIGIRVADSGELIAYLCLKCGLVKPKQEVEE
jgi:predicted RNA-binding Zn-ribbon protein involved in translation (DUF1610 family)